MKKNKKIKIIILCFALMFVISGCVIGGNNDIVNDNEREGDALNSLNENADSPKDIPAEYKYIDSIVCESFIKGTNDGSIVAVNPKALFKEGETAYSITEMNDVKVDHRYKVEVWKDAKFYWDYVGKWNIIGQNPWEYSFFTPSQSKVSEGAYEFKIFLDIGEGFIFLDSKKFSVK